MKKPRRKLSCLGCLGTLALLVVVFVLMRAMPATPVVATVPTVAPTPTLSAIVEWSHWHQASSTLRFDYAAVWVRKAYPDTGNADLVRLAHEVVACMDAAGTQAPFADTGAACLVQLRP